MTFEPAYGAEMDDATGRLIGTAPQANVLRTQSFGCDFNALEALASDRREHGAARRVGGPADRGHHGGRRRPGDAVRRVDEVGLDHRAGDRPAIRPEDHERRIGRRPEGQVDRFRLAVERLPRIDRRDPVAGGVRPDDVIALVDRCAAPRFGQCEDILPLRVGRRMRRRVGWSREPGRHPHVGAGNGPAPVVEDAAGDRHRRFLGLLAGRRDREQGQCEARDESQPDRRPPQPVPEQRPEDALGQPDRRGSESHGPRRGELDRRPRRRFRESGRDRAAEDDGRGLGRFEAQREQSGGRRQAASHEPRAERRAAAAQPRLDRANPAPERRGGLFPGLSLQVAEDDRRPIALGQPLDLLEQFGHQLRRWCGLAAFGACTFGEVALQHPAAGGLGPRRAATRCATP